MPLARHERALAAALPAVLALWMLAACSRPPLAPVVSAGESVTASDLTFEGAPPPAEFADVVAEHTNAVLELAERCYADRLGARPVLAGELRLLVYVSAAQVIRVTTEDSTLDDTPLEDCVKEELLRYELPPGTPRSGVHVRFRLLFAPPRRSG